MKAIAFHEKLQKQLSWEKTNNFVTSCKKEWHHNYQKVDIIFASDFLVLFSRVTKVEPLYALT